MIKVGIIPAFDDNYIYLIYEDKNKWAIVIDAGDAGPVINFLEKNNLELTHILNTHHHDDHIGGNKKLCNKYPNCKIIAPKKELSRIPNIDILVNENDIININNLNFKVIETKGHTIGHVVYYCEELSSVFVGDVLFSIGSGKIFEGTAEDMFKSLSKIKSLPDNTKIYFAHEYTKSNIEFALSIYSNRDLRRYKSNIERALSRGEKSTPTILSLEKRLNPFLTAKTSTELKAIRDKKDNFRYRTQHLEQVEVH